MIGACDVLVMAYRENLIVVVLLPLAALWGIGIGGVVAHAGLGTPVYHNAPLDAYLAPGPA